MLALLLVPGFIRENGGAYRAIEAISALLSVCVFYYVSKRELTDRR